jgi:hypothetical protein
MWVRVSHIGIRKITKKLFWIICLYYFPSDTNDVKFSFGHCVRKPDLCCGLEDHPKRIVDQQDIWYFPSQSEKSVGLWTRQLHFLSRIHILFDKILWYFRGWWLIVNFVLIQYFVTSYFRLYVNRSSLFWYVTQLTLLVIEWRFGTTSRPHLQDSSSSKCNTWPLKLGPIGCPETSVTKLPIYAVYLPRRVNISQCF